MSIGEWMFLASCCLLTLNCFVSGITDNYGGHCGLEAVGLRPPLLSLR